MENIGHQSRFIGMENQLHRRVLLSFVPHVWEDWFVECLKHYAHIFLVNKAGSKGYSANVELCWIRIPRIMDWAQFELLE